MFADFKILWKLILLSQIFEILSIYKPSLGLGGYVSFRARPVQQFLNLLN